MHKQSKWTNTWIASLWLFYTCHEDLLAVRRVNQKINLICDPFLAKTWSHRGIRFPRDTMRNAESVSKLLHFFAVRIVKHCVIDKLDWLMTEACRQGQVHFVKQLPRELHSQEALMAACERPHMEIVRFLSFNTRLAPDQFRIVLQFTNSAELIRFLPGAVPFQSSFLECKNLAATRAVLLRFRPTKREVENVLRNSFCSLSAGVLLTIYCEDPWSNVRIEPLSMLLFGTLKLALWNPWLGLAVGVTGFALCRHAKVHILCPTLLVVNSISRTLIFTAGSGHSLATIQGFLGFSLWTILLGEEAVYIKCSWDSCWGPLARRILPLIFSA
jgi:hypothetical protein